MNKWAVIFRGKKVDEIEAETNFDATKIADELGYFITQVDIRKMN